LRSFLAEYGRRTALVGVGGNPYRSKAYLRCAESLVALAEPLDRIVAEGTLSGRKPGTDSISSTPSGISLRIRSSDGCVPVRCSRVMMSGDGFPDAGDLA
jgi:hypothetical protein